MKEQGHKPFFDSGTEGYRALFDLSVAATLILNSDGRVVDANAAAARLLGYSADELTSMSVEELTDDSQAFVGSDSDEASKGQADLVMKNGDIQRCDYHFSRIGSEASDNARFGMLQITAVKNVSAEDEHLRLFESVVKGTSDAVVIIKAPSKSKTFDAEIVFVNRAYTELSGYGFDELIGEPARFLEVPESAQPQLNQLRKAIEDSIPIEMELLSYKKNGEELWVHISLTPVFDGDTCTHFIAIAKDITQRKNREALANMQSEISRIFNNHDTLTESVDESLKMLLGLGDFTIAELWLANSDKQIISMAGHRSIDKAYEDLFRKSDKVHVFKRGEGLPGVTWDTGEVQFWRNIGENDRFVRNEQAKEVGVKTAYGVPIYFDDRVVGTLLLGVKEDQKKQRYYTPLLEQIGNDLGSEIDRKRTEEELNRIFSFSPDILCVAGLDGYFKQVNPAMSRLLGFSKDELLSQPISSFTHPDDRQRTENEIDALNKNEGANSFQNRYLTKSGEVVWLSWTTQTFFEEGKIYSVARDITEQKELEILLNQANRMAKIGGWEYDVVKDEIFWSDVVRDIHKVPKDVEIDIDKGIEFYKEGFSRETIVQKVNEAIETGRSFDEELQIITYDGNERWVRAIGEAEIVGGRVKKIYGSFQDIHDRKSYEERLKNTTNNLPGIIFQYILDKEGNDSLRYLSEGSNELWGISSEQAMDNISLIWDRIDTRDIEEMKGSIVKSAETLTKWHHEWRYRHPDGVLRWQEGYGTPKKLADRSVQWDSIILDITEKKEIEYLLKQASQLAKIGSWEVDLRSSSNEMYWYDMTREILEVENGKNVTLDGMLNYYMPESKERAQKAVSEVLENGGSFDLELQIVTGKGREKWIRSIGQVEFEDGEAVLMYGSYQDIDSRKRIEEKLKDKTRHMEAISKLNSALLNYQAWAEAIDENLEIIGRAINADRAYYFENHYDPETGEGFTTEKLEWNREGITPQLDNPEMESVPFSAVPELIDPMLNHEPSGGIISDIEEDNMTRQVMIDQGIKAFMAVPVIVRGNFYGFLGFDNCTNEQYWSREEEKMVKTIATNLATAIERDKIDLELEKLLNERNSILESIGDVFFTLDDQFTVTYWNKKAEELFEMPQEKVQGKNLWTIFPDAIESKSKEMYERAFEENTSVSFEQYYTGSWFEVNAYRYGDGLSVICKDITQRKIAEQKNREKTQQLNAIAMFNGLLIQHDSWSDAINESLELFGKVLNADRVYYFQNSYSNELGERTATIMNEWSRPPTKPRSNSNDNKPMPFSELGEFLKDLEHNRVYSNHVENISDSRFRKLLKTFGIKSILAAPIFVGDKFYGCIGFDDCEKTRDWTDGELKFLKTISFNLASAIENEEAEEAIERTLREKIEILESIGDAFFAVDEDWTVTYWNSMAEKELDMDREKIVGKNLWEIYSDATELEFYKQYHKALNEQVTVTFDEYYPAAEKWFEVSAYPSSEGLSIFFKNVTERKQTEQQLRELNERLKRQTEELAVSNAELEQFAFVASHDLQEPLRMVTSFLNQLEKKYSDQLDDKARQYIWFATDGAKRMRQMILDLLNYSRIGRLSVDPEPVDLNEILDGVVKDYHRTIREKDAEVKWSSLPTILADKSSIYRLMSNLVSNALKYSSSDDGPVVEITAEETPKSWRIAVRDNGIGISEEYRERIFQVFQRLHSNNEYSGTGIGLAICRKIVEHHHGKIWVESNDGNGSTFKIEIPKSLRKRETDSN